MAGWQLSPGTGEAREMGYLRLGCCSRPRGDIIGDMRSLGNMGLRGFIKSYKQTNDHVHLKASVDN